MAQRSKRFAGLLGKVGPSPPGKPHPMAPMASFRSEAFFSTVAGSATIALHASRFRGGIVGPAPSSGGACDAPQRIAQANAMRRGHAIDSGATPSSPAFLPLAFAAAATQAAIAMPARWRRRTPRSSHSTGLHLP